MKPISIDKKTIRPGGQQRLESLAALSGVPKRCCKCGFGLSRNDSSNYTDQNNCSSLAYCRQCGLVSSKVAGSLGNDSEECLQVSEQLGEDTTTYVIGSRKGPVEMMSRLWMSQSKAADQIQKNFALALGEITKAVQALSLQPSLASEAADLCMMAFVKGITKGASIHLLSATVVYASARLDSLPVTIDEVVRATNLARSDVIRCFRKLQRRLNLRFEASSPEAHVAKIMTILSMPESELHTAANNIIRSADKSGRILGKNPAAVAAAAIYLALTRVDDGSIYHHHYHRLTQRKLALAANVTETTIRRACHNLERY